MYTTINNKTLKAISQQNKYKIFQNKRCFPIYKPNIKKINIKIFIICLKSLNQKNQKTLSKITIPINKSWISLTQPFVQRTLIFKMIARKKIADQEIKEEGKNREQNKVRRK